MIPPQSKQTGSRTLETKAALLATLRKAEAGTGLLVCVFVFWAGLKVIRLGEPIHATSGNVLSVCPDIGVFHFGIDIENHLSGLYRFSGHSVDSGGGKPVLDWGIRNNEGLTCLCRQWQVNGILRKFLILILL